MRAIVFEAGAAAVREVEPRVPSSSDVLVTVSRTGMCGTDLGIVRRGRPQVSGPVTLGHEIFGHIPDGTRVVVNPFLTCGECPACTRDESNLCETLRIIGVHTDGGFADAVAVPRSQVVQVPDGVSDAQASLVEPVATALHAWRRAASTTTPYTVGVIGAGAIGLSVVAVALAHDAELSVADVDPAMLKHASSQGPIVTGATLHGTFDVVFECVGLESTRQQAIEAARPGGTVIMIGLAEPELVLEGRSIVTFERTVRGTFGYSHEDFVDALQIVADMPTDWVGELSLEELADAITGAQTLSPGIAKAQFVRAKGNNSRSHEEAPQEKEQK